MTILLYFLAHSIISLTYCAYKITDLDKTSTEFETQVETGWIFQGSSRADSKTNICGSDVYLGGKEVAGKGAYASKTYTGIPPHNTIYFEMTVVIIDEWLNNRINLYFNSNPIMTWPFPNNMYEIHFCQNSQFKDLKMILRGFVSHNEDSLLFEINSTLMLSGYQAAWGIRDLNFIFLNYTDSGTLPFSLCGSTSDYLPPGAHCQCNIDEYVDSFGNCSPCPAPCSRCYGNSYHQCLIDDNAPPNTFYANCPDNCKSCHSDLQCIECKPGFCGTECTLCPPTTCNSDIDCSTSTPYCHSLNKICAPILVKFVNPPEEIYPTEINSIQVIVVSIDPNFSLNWTISPNVSFEITTSGIRIFQFSTEETTMDIHVVAVNSALQKDEIKISIPIIQGNEPAIISDVLTGTKAVTIGMVVSAGPMMLSGVDPTLAWGMINLMQMIYYLLFFNIEYSSDLTKFLDLFKIGRLTFLPNPIKLSLPNLDSNRLPSPKNFFDNDFSGLFLQSAGSMLFVIITSILTLVLTEIALIFFRNSKILGEIKKFYVWSGLLRTWTVSYFDLSISGFLQLFQINFSGITSFLSSVLGIVVASLNLAFPLLIYSILKRIKLKRTNISRFEPIIEDFDVNVPIKKNFMIIIISRKYLHALFMVVFYSVPIFQVLTIWMLNAIYLYLLITYRPHVRQINNIVNIGTEVVFFAIHSFLLGLTMNAHKDELSPKTKNLIGWGILLCCLLLVVKEGIALLLEQFATIKSQYQKCFKTKTEIKNTGKACKVKVKKVNQHAKLTHAKSFHITVHRIPLEREISSLNHQTTYTKRRVRSNYFR